MLLRLTARSSSVGGADSQRIELAMRFFGLAIYKA